MATTYYASTKREPSLLLRRIADGGGIVDEAYLDGAWQPTALIVDHLFGHNDFVDEITDAQARDLEPKAVPRPTTARTDGEGEEWQLPPGSDGADPRI